MRPRLTALLLLACAPLAVATAPARPNVLLILADDLGASDLPAYGNTFHETPHLDRLAREGLRFTQFYAGPVCSPTRANLQSGQDQARFGITQHIPGHRRPYARLRDPQVPGQLPLEVVTFAEALRGAGYATGYFGKWHLGGAGFGPREQGWDTAEEFQGHTRGEDRAAAHLADRAIEFLNQPRPGPFLLQLSFYAVHIPLTTTPELLAKYQAKPPRPPYPSRPEYAGLLEELDTAIGRVLAELDRRGLAGNTVVWFLSDNGGLEHEQSGRIVTSNAPLRGEKGTLYEGGVRIPALVRWPGRVPAGAVAPSPATTQDVHPTLLALAGALAPAGQPRDGEDLGPVLARPETPRTNDTLYWHLPHYHHSTPASAVRRGPWKLVEFLEDGRLELFSLAEDPGEQVNLAAREPARAASLRADLDAWRRRVGARMPEPNPDHDPARATELAGRANRERRNRR